MVATVHAAMMDSGDAAVAMELCIGDDRQRGEDEDEDGVRGTREGVR